ncbi:methylglyoxal synthase [Clostridium beijerinckii]|uniref:methylglyoxal synthase n=1 Tax=Clostridium beijerinckii TaxID=1520 RepID=UPI0017E00989|nr:methylglyoxal synthase [Clostridium beijerinckii]NOW06670.1 methylglyoxal synthase [Clostridium beijerinckii]NYC00186.1 methylglyoxal synthase [Clostridium beijerinckii]
MTSKINKQKKIALIAHDNKKDDLVNWVNKNNNILVKHFLCGTGTTSRIISERTSLPVKAYRSGPLGGDQQIGAAIVDGKVDFMIFFWDTLTAQPHDPDVKALLRIAVLFDIPVAMNQSTADFILNSTLMEEEYESLLINNTKIKN